MTDPGLYEPLVSREFKSTIPVHLLGKLSDGERHMIETLSRLENQYEWMFQSLAHQNRMVVDLARRQSNAEEWKGKIDPKIDNHDKAVSEISGQVQALRDWKSAVVGKTGILFWLATIVIPVVLKTVIDWMKP
jgi:hypothetical protein